MIQDGNRGRVMVPARPEKPENVSWVLSALQRMDEEGHLSSTAARVPNDDHIQGKTRDKRKYRLWKQLHGKDQHPARAADSQHQYTLDGQRFFSTRAKMAAWYKSTTRQEEAKRLDDVAKAQQEQIRSAMRARLIRKAIAEGRATLDGSDSITHSDPLVDHIWIRELKFMQRDELRELANELSSQNQYGLVLPGSLGVNALAARIVDYLHPTNEENLPELHTRSQDGLLSGKIQGEVVACRRDGRLSTLDGKYDGLIRAANSLEPTESLNLGNTPSELDQMCFPFTDISSELVRRHTTACYFWQRVLREAQIAERKVALRAKIEVQKLRIAQCKVRDELLAVLQIEYDEAFAKWDAKAQIYRQRMGMNSNDDVGNAVGAKPIAPSASNVLQLGVPFDGAHQRAQEKVRDFEKRIMTINAELVARPPLNVRLEEFFTVALVFQTVQTLAVSGDLSGVWSRHLDLRSAERSVKHEAPHDPSGEIAPSFVDLYCTCPGYSLAAALLNPRLHTCCGLAYSHVDTDVLSLVRRVYSRNVKAGVFRSTHTAHVEHPALAYTTAASRPDCAAAGRFLRDTVGVILVCSWIEAQHQGTIEKLLDLVCPGSILVVYSKSGVESLGSSASHRQSQTELIDEMNRANKSEATIDVGQNDPPLHQLTSESRPHTPSLVAQSTSLVNDRESHSTLVADGSRKSDWLVGLLTTTGSVSFKMLQHCVWRVGDYSVTASFFERRKPLSMSAGHVDEDGSENGSSAFDFEADEDSDSVSDLS